MTNKKDISKVMRHLRAKRKDYSTAGFKNPEVQRKIAATKKANRDKHLKDAEEFAKLESL
jgi:hypothetical protein